MAKDYTDYVAQIFGGGERVYHFQHFRQLRHDPEETQFEFNGRTYRLNKDRASRTRLAPWKKWDKRRPLDSLYEIFRSKKIGLVPYREPELKAAELEEVITQVPVSFSCKICPYTSKKERHIKVHVGRKHKGAKADMVIVPEMKEVREWRPKVEFVEPYHISRIHQPSGRMKSFSTTVPAEPYPSAPTKQETSPYEWDLDFPPLTETITPRILKAIVDSPQFRKAYKSFKFGNLTPLAGKWWLWIILAVVGIFGILIITGNFQLR